MLRALCLALGLAALACTPAAPALAQVGTKAYAPEDLTRLAVRDRVRVIEREYAEQSGGRRIPDDQLEFYLDQIESGWSWSHIRQDIAESLQRTGWRPGRPGWSPREVICSSDRDRRRECAKPFRGPAILSEQLSHVRCIEGVTWGQRRDTIWVDRGCRGRFAEDTRRPVVGDGVVCESREGRRRRCTTGFRFPPMIAEQYSHAPCLQGETWGWSPGEVWVSRGCRALFVEVRADRPGGGWPRSGYSIRCKSDNYEYNSCEWRGRGRPFLISQVSRAACIEGRTWGWTGDRVWVDHGCDAHFGDR